MRDVAEVNIFQEVTVPRVVQAILGEEGWGLKFWVGDGDASTHLSINFQGRRPIQIPRTWEIDAGHPLTLKNWIAAKIQAALANTPRSRPLI